MVKSNSVRNKNYQSREGKKYCCANYENIKKFFLSQKPVVEDGLIEDGLIEETTDKIPSPNKSSTEASLFIRDYVHYTNSLLKKLKEKNSDIFERIVCHCGIQLCNDILKETLDIEKIGGLYTENNIRRTAGGVFIHLLRQRLSKDDIKFIWLHQNHRQATCKRLKKKHTTHLDALIKANYDDSI